MLLSSLPPPPPLPPLPPLLQSQRAKQRCNK
jgi:hypothetical protein